MRVPHSTRRVCLTQTVGRGHTYVSAQLAPMRHSDDLGNIQRLRLIASGSYNSPTSNRIVALVQLTSPPDVVALFIDKHLGTDPEYFSSDVRMNVSALRSASSVRHVLGIPHSSTFCVRSIHRLSSQSTKTFTNAYGDTEHGKMHVLFSIKWKANALDGCWNGTTLSIFTANAARNNHATSRVGTASDEFGKLYTTFNTNWCMKVVRTISPNQ